MLNHSGDWINVVAKVMHCIHIEDDIHEIGVQFLSRVDIRRIIDDEVDQAQEAFNPPRMVGRALCVLESYQDRSELRAHLTSLGVTSVMSNLGEQAIALVEGLVPLMS